MSKVAFQAQNVLSSTFSEETKWYAPWTIAGVATLAWEDDGNCHIWLILCYVAIHLHTRLGQKQAQPQTFSVHATSLHEDLEQILMTQNTEVATSLQNAVVLFCPWTGAGKHWHMLLSSHQIVNICTQCDQTLEIHKVQLFEVIARHNQHNLITSSAGMQRDRSNSLKHLLCCTSIWGLPFQLCDCLCQVCKGLTGPQLRH